MTYAFGGRLDDDSYAITYIDEDQGTAETRGAINGVPFESPEGVLRITEDEGTLDKTWSEIASAIAGGKIAYIYGSVYEDDTLIVAGCNIVAQAINDDGTYYIYLMGQDLSSGYSTSSANGYPVFFD